MYHAYDLRYIYDICCCTSASASQNTLRAPFCDVWPVCVVLLHMCCYHTHRPPCPRSSSPFPLRSGACPWPGLISAQTTSAQTQTITMKNRAWMIGDCHGKPDGKGPKSPYQMVGIYSTGHTNSIFRLLCSRRKSGKLVKKLSS